MLESKEFLYIIGSPRSGTTMLQILLSNHPQVASTVEQTLFQHYVSPWLETWKTEVYNLETQGWKLGLPILWKEDELVEVLKGFLEKAYGKILETKPGATHILDKHPGYSLHVDTIRRFLPKARFIHMIRDGRDVAASTLAAHAKMGFGPNTVSTAAQKWKTFLQAARTAARFGDDYIEIRYEEFLEGKAETYAKVLEFCGLPYEKEWIEKTLAANTFEKMKESGVSPDGKTKLSANRYYRGKAGGWQEDFSARDRYDFNRIAGDLLCELGYARPGWWTDSVLDRLIQPLRHNVAKRGPLLWRTALMAGGTVLGRDEEYFAARQEASKK
jgi:hypothetical protein